QAEDGIRDYKVTGVQTCALPICRRAGSADGPVMCQPNRTLTWLAGARVERLTFLRHVPARRAATQKRAGSKTRRFGRATVRPKRSEERRVGQEGTPRWAAGHRKE